MFETAELGQKMDKDAFDARVPALREALLDAQFALRESARFATVIVIAGVEGSGKGELLHRLLEWLDARGIAAHALGEPTDEELAHPPHWRFWRRLPARGGIGIFLGSWYAAPIVDRTFGRLPDDRFDIELRRIVELERMLARENTLLLKYWLHIPKKQQRKTFEKFENDEYESWRVTRRDWELHEHYAELRDTAEHAIRRTSKSYAPWTIVESTDDRFRDVTVAEHLASALEAKLKEPPPPPIPPPEPPVPAPVNILSTLDLSRQLDEKEYDEQLDRYQGRLGRLARSMHEAGVSAMLVFEGADAAGKGGSIRRVTQALDARFYRVIPIAAPTDEERAHPYLWRFWRHVPRRGSITIWDRSWYGRVLVERIEGFCSEEAWQRAYGEINSFEEQLTRAGVVIVKFWLTISEDEQLRRFEERERTGHKRHKITADDWRNREKWSAYEAAAAEMIGRTGTRDAPWTIVGTNDKRLARIEVLRTVCERLEQEVGDGARPKDGGKRKKRKDKKK
jgi:polyphosphate:AMP phosphotransferase